MKAKALVIGRLLNAAIPSCSLCTALLGTTSLGGVFSDQGALDQSSVFAAQNPIFNTVVRVSVYHDFLAGTGAGGSAVVIGNNSDWLLTSGHIFNDVLNQGGIQQIQVRVGNNATTPDFVVQGDAWYVYPGFTGTGTGQGVDLGLIHLSTSINSVTPATLYSGSQSSLTGVPAYMCGYGIPGLAGQGLFASDKIKRAGENIIGDASYPSWLESQYLISRFDAPSSPSAVALEWQGSPGDSGGPWMVQDSGIWQVAGISSGGTLDPSYNFGNITYATGVSSNLDWIYGVIGVKPSLSIQDGGTNGVRVQWPSWAASYVLQSCTDVAGSNWVAAAGGLADDGTNRSATFSVSTNGQQFWRLARQAALVARSEAVSASPVWQGETGTNLLIRGFHEEP